MRMRQVWIRFYKSFNYDFELKAHPDSNIRQWEMTPDGWRPYVGVPLEPDITAVVGANESGKSHLLDAIAIVLTGKGLEQRDFCRYSSLFSVEIGKRRHPEVGATFELDELDRSALAEVGIPLQANGDLLMFRRAPNVIEVLTTAGEHVRLKPDQAAAVTSRLPHVHKLDTQVDLPDAVSIAALAGQPPVLTSRKRRFDLLQFFTAASTAQKITDNATTLAAMMNSTEPDHADKQQLGRDLLTKIARIDQSSFIELQQAIAEEREGLVNGLIQEMNKSIARHLNVSRWWSQDADFELRVSPREHELVFTIRDRTGTDYSFSERSRGLTYFLSYYVQLRSHHRPDDRPEVLLMDEPDAYLSALGQQDLLRVLENHARPEDSDRVDQVVYVTHSPFLINRNASHRVRVVDKGTRDEGTRLVKNSTQNHYEPLRTSLGAAVAETAFIGGDNLFIEGISDQVLLTGMNARLVRAGIPPSRRLDLNQVTLVPGGSNVPYMLYLARGRDQYKPACAVLLDSDKAGRDAKKAIQRGGAKGKPTVPDDLIVMIGDWAATAGAIAEPGVSIEEPEDLVPLSLAGMAARRYARMYLGMSEAEAAALSDDAIKGKLTDDCSSMWDAVDAAFTAAFETDIAKVGFAKELLAYIGEQDGGQNVPVDVATLDRNFALLTSTLTETLRTAREREDASRRDQRVERIIDAYAKDHPTGASKDDAATMLKRIDAATDNTPAGDIIRAGSAGLGREYQLEIDPLAKIERYEEFLAELETLPRRARLTGQGHLSAVAAAATNSGLPVAGRMPSFERDDTDASETEGVAQIAPSVQVQPTGDTQLSEVPTQQAPSQDAATSSPDQAAATESSGLQVVRSEPEETSGEAPATA